MPRYRERIDISTRGRRYGRLEEILKENTAKFSGRSDTEYSITVRGGSQRRKAPAVIEVNITSQSPSILVEVIRVSPADFTFRRDKLRHAKPLVRTITNLLKEKKFSPYP